jgi:hypothetical protein
MHDPAYRERELAKARARYRRRMADPEEAERIRAADRARRAANREAERARRRTAYWRNPDAARARGRAYYHRRRAEDEQLMRTPGADLAALAAACPATLAWLRVVLADEVDRGRLHRDPAGVYRVIPGAFDPATVAGFLQLDGSLPVFGSVNGNGRPSISHYEEVKR